MIKFPVCVSAVDAQSLSERMKKWTDYYRKQGYVLHDIKFSTSMTATDVHVFHDYAAIMIFTPQR